MTTGQTMMRAVEWTGVDTVEAVETAMPDVPPGWALVKVAYSGLCGTDLSIFHGTHPRAAAPLIMGHEISGTVVVAGETGPAEGSFVIAEPLISCGTCKACREGHSHVCRRLRLFGIDSPGGLAEYVALPGDRLHELPADTDPLVATLTEPLAVAVHAVSKSLLQPGDTVAVFGAGPIGTLTALVARHAGAGAVVIAEPNAWRRSVVEGLGFTAVADSAAMTAALHDMTDGEGADVTFDTAGHPSVASEVSAATRVLGNIVVVGVYKQPSAIDLQRINFAEQSVQGVRVYTGENVREAVALVAADALGLGRLPISVYGFDAMDDAFAAAQRGDDTLKVLVSPTAGVVR